MWVAESRAIREHEPVIGLAILLLTGLGLIWAAGVGLTVWLLTHPPRRTYGSAVARGRPGDPSEMAEAPRGFERWTFRSRGMEFPVWDIPGEDPRGPVAIMTHGWADSKIGGLVRIGALAPVASRIVIWDQAGHGEAPGSCRLGTAEVDDLLALIEEVRPARLVLVGWSLGAGVSLAAAASAPKSITVLGVVAEAPYRFPGTPASNVLRSRGLPAPILITPAFLLLRLLCGRDLAAPRFDRAARARASGARVLVIHGTCDVVCPVQDGRDVAAAAGGRMLEVEGGGHNDLWTDSAFAAVCEQAVQEFVRDGATPA
jgi:uncharacterized protein